MHCYFCKSILVDTLKVDHYLMCSSCQIFVRSSGDNQSFMVNENLKNSSKVNKLVLEQTSALLRESKTRKGLIDFGCGGGKFLCVASKYFKSAAGIEITPESIEIAQKNGIMVYQKIPKKGFTVITFWHSLEHLPFETLQETLLDIGESEIQSVLLSVPNSKSFTLRAFGKYDCFVDETNHNFIFSMEKVVELFKGIGFELKSTPRLKSYTIFGSVQSSINFVTRTKNHLYFTLKRNQSFRNFSFFRHLILAPVYLPLSAITIILVILKPKQDSVINLSFQRSR